MACQKDHSDISYVMSRLPDDQGGLGRHKCAACAYHEGFNRGKKLNDNEIIDISKVLDSLEESQAGAQRHKSPHAAFAQGYLDGVRSFYEGR